ncbi:XRE family transcriptional regulator [Parapedobacter lycopersici]|uniref:XRE family transcriptional regulator n=1 Tax=Parapedobacter lycopersici TaxID=1864939 RepID=UPI00214DD98D|nr:XRE family transcriptional regulator [Parapedobacter lycopersici]
MSVYQDDNVSWRVKKLRELLKMKQQDFAVNADLKQSQISQVESGSRNITPEIILKLRKAYKVNIDWLEEGIGEIFELKSDEIQLSGDHVPFFDMDVTGSIVESFSDIQESPTFYIDFKPFNDCTAYFRIYGDSMYPKYAGGEIVAVKEVQNRNTILWGEAYLIVTDASENNLRTVKTVHPCESDEGCIVLRASNPNFRGDTIIRKESIISMFIIKGKTRIDHL